MARPRSAHHNACSRRRPRSPSEDPSLASAPRWMLTCARSSGRAERGLVVLDDPQPGAERGHAAARRPSARRSSASASHARDRASAGPTERALLARAGASRAVG